MDKKIGRRIRPLKFIRVRRLKALWHAASLKEHTSSVLAALLCIASLLLFLGILLRLPGPAPSAPDGETEVSYTTLLNQVKAGKILAVTIQGDELSGTLTDQACASSSNQNANSSFAATWTSASSQSTCTLSTQLPSYSDGSFLSLLLSHHIVVKTLPAKQSYPTLFFYILGLAPVLMLLFATRRSSWNKPTSSDASDTKFNQLRKSHAHRFEQAPENRQPWPASEVPSPARSPAHVVERARTNVTFADVAGIDEVRAELEEIVQFLRSPERFQRLGAHIPRGVLLVGPPGTGKTLLAKAVAGEAGVPFFSMSASEFVEMFVGVGASRVRDLFQQARQAAPCVVFLDEIDAVGRQRSMRLVGSAERDQTLNQLLVELDGFASRETIIVLAATNRVDMLDKALLRPGRFDRQLTVSLPDVRGREAILRVHTRHTPLSARVRLQRLARRTSGMSGADLANLVNEAALTAARQGLNSVTPECFDEALARVQLGAQRRLVISEDERRVLAYRESGHALVASYLPEADPVHSITILPRGQRLGATQFTPQEDHYNYSRATLIARIAVELGGRTAVELAFGPVGVTTGAEQDLREATDLARRMVTQWGMGSRVCAACSSQSSRSMAETIDSEVQHILQDGQSIARALLIEHSSQLAKLADMLMEHEQLDREQFEALLRA
jgi:ATP-dependent metalloprotease FtsH